MTENDYSIVGGDERTEHLLTLAESVAQTPSTVLISGESGVGKENLARYIHAHSPVRNGPFIAVNCASLASSLLESELFGHERGSFSGAFKQHLGVFERANGGTLLLDEVSEISTELQAKLLRVLQERVLVRVGGRTEIKLDVRILASTNRDLRVSIRDGEFRSDLYYRLNVFPLHILPLRERPGDIVPMLLHHGRRLAARYGLQFHGFTTEALDALQAYDYPGNVRELVNIVERALVLAQGAPHIQRAQILLENRGGPFVPREEPALRPGVDIHHLWEQIEEDVLSEGVDVPSDDEAVLFPATPEQASVPAEQPAGSADEPGPSAPEAAHAPQQDPPAHPANAAVDQQTAPPSADFTNDMPQHSGETLPEAELLRIVPGQETLALVEQRIILRTLAALDGNRTRTAEALGVSIRTLRNRIREYRDRGLDVPEPGGGSQDTDP